MKNRSFLISLVLLASIQLTAQLNPVTAQNNHNIHSKSQAPVKNVILLIGDGMGLPQVYAAMAAKPDALNLARFTNTAIVKTASADDDITDSAAGGTAIATGTKTYNGAIGVDVNNKPLKSILKIFEEQGLSTGLVATCDITHATPASFIANVESRGQADAIAAQFLKTDVDVFIGGGFNNFGKRKDSVNYIDSLKARNYTVALSVDDIKKHSHGKLAGLIYPKHAPKMSEGRGDMLSIATTKALDILSENDKGFFLMIEGSQIDWGGHDNNIDYLLSELFDFDQAIGKALDFADNNPGTLIIVTADHETGGLTLIEDKVNKNKMTYHFSTNDHSALPVPLFAYGSGAELFSGFIDNTDISRLILKALRLPINTTSQK